MRYLLTIITVACIFIGCKPQNSKLNSDKKESPEVSTSLMSFDEGTSVHFGNVKGFMKLTHAFVFRNASDSVPLVIDSIRAGCGCTTFSYPHHPISPGDKDTIFVTYDTNLGYNGYFSKSLTVFSNSPYPIDLTVSGDLDLEAEE